MRTKNKEPKTYLPAMVSGALVLALGATLPLGCSLTPTAAQGSAGTNSSTGNSSNTGAGSTSVGTGGSGTTTTGGSGTTTGGSGTTTGGSGTTTGGMATVAPNDPSCQKDPFVPLDILSTIDPSVTTTINNMSQSDKLNILNGGQVCPNYDCDFNATGIPSQGYPDMPMRDGPRGVHQLTGAQSTTWAVAEARAATWDTALELQVGTAQGEEMRAYKYDTSLSPTINVLRHPGWARAQETYGEDPVLVGEMGAQFTLGMQANVMACPKHFAGNDTDNNRHTAYAQMDEQTLRENYTRAFGIIVQKADPACIMAAYNGLTVTDSVTDKTPHWCTESHHLLTDILRTEWNWKGYVVSDWWATKANGAASINAGLDLEMPDMSAFQQLPTDLTNNTVTTATITQADTRLLNARQHFKNNTMAYQNSAANPAIVQNMTHIAVAKQTSLEGAVLLKNASILPIPAGKSIILLGPDNNLPDASKVGTANAASGLGDRGSSNTTPPYAVSYFSGLKTLGYTVTQSANAADASKADIAIVIVSMAHEDEGEAFDGGADRQNLNLAGPHPLHWTAQKPSAFIAAAAAANPNLVVLLNVGSAIVMEDWINSAKGIVQTFYPGQEGGNAVAELLTGKANFSGKLPFTVAEKETDYPAFQNNSANAMTFDYLHGYRKFEAQGLTPRFWFGYGLSYTTFKYSNLKLLCTNAISRTGRLNVQVTVQNTGTVDGDEIVELYVGYPTTAPGVRRPKKELKSFARVHIAAGQSQDVQLNVPASYIAYYDGTKNVNGWSFEPSGYMYDLIVAGSSDPADANLQKASFSIGAN
jgi:beta-glucosidase